jgi:FlaA1/EpsC-like NDP-sugar epimerase
VARKDVSRVLVYGGGLRYRFFRRELVRTTAANERIIVGILDDDILLHGKYIGGIQVLGSIQDAPALINRVNADAVVIACEQTAEQAARVKALLAPTGVSVSLFALSERPL